ncbi:DUF1194 domain-containing protein [Crocosphaera sp.]|uniref:DUF1194 domain-containing protein n=1 Tax=Crocosphaera sp. TaxID=2729996 RepID=UPI003F27CA27
MKKYTLISKGVLGTTGIVSILGFAAMANAAQLTPVSLELAIIIDASESISQDSFDRQLVALDNIFNDPNFYNDFVSPLKDIPSLNIDDPSLAVGIFQFGSKNNGRFHSTTDIPILEPILDWTVFNEQRQSGIGSLNPSNINKVGGLTPLSDLLSLMTDELSNNDYDGHQVINLSSDGLETYSETTFSKATRDAFITGVTFNALVIPSTGTVTVQGERVSSGNLDESYDVQVLQSIVDRYGFLEPEDKNNNLAGNPAFVMLDYATGEKTLEDAFRLKLGLETIGRAPAARPDVDEPNTDSSGPGRDSSGPGEGTVGNPAAQHIPEPSSLFGLLSVSLLGFLRQKKKA